MLRAISLSFASMIDWTTWAIAGSPRPAAASSCSAPRARAIHRGRCARAHSSVCSTSARAEFVSSVAWWRDCSSNRLPRVSASRCSRVASAFDFVKEVARLHLERIHDLGPLALRIDAVALDLGLAILQFALASPAPPPPCAAAATRTPSVRRARGCRRTRPRRGSGAASPCAPRARWARRSRSCGRPGAHAVAPAAARYDAGTRRRPRGRSAPRSLRPSAATGRARGAVSPADERSTHLTTSVLRFPGSRGRPRRGLPRYAASSAVERKSSTRLLDELYSELVSCSCVTSDSAPLIRSTPAWFFGNAITSRRFGSCRRAPSPSGRSRARPAIGGAPIASASSRKPNFERCSASLIEQLEHARLDLRLVDPEAAAAELVAVDNQVVGVRKRVLGIVAEAGFPVVRRPRGGWCTAVQRPSSSSRSNIGNS